MKVYFKNKKEEDKYMILHICRILKSGTNRPIYKTEIESQMLKTSIVTKRKGGRIKQEIP